MKRFLILLTLTLSSIIGKAQTASDSVKAVINELFAAMKNAEPERLKACFADSMVLQTIARSKEGELFIRTESAADFVTSISKLTAGAADEQIIFESVKVDGPLAQVWTPYKFYYNGQFSHCGVNSFQVVRFKSGWKIQYIIDTRRRTGCD